MNEHLTPVEIPGYSYLGRLGMSERSHVALYRQELTDRKVAVKILHSRRLDATSRAAFEQETGLMVELSSHPSIATISFAAVTEDGRPYLVMEYCSRPNLAQRSRQCPLQVPEMLQTMIRLCGAVETAHRQGILHRDISPANVLTTDDGWPALTGFGISSLVDQNDQEEGGVSIAWAPPEVLHGNLYIDQRADIYSLAATGYTLLTGRSPFSQAAGADEAEAVAQLVQRIMNAPVPPIRRADVPLSLERVLALAMSKQAEHRPDTVAELARSLQRIEQELHLPQTQFDVATPAVLDDDRTQLVSHRPGTGHDGDDDDHTFVADRTRRARPPRATMPPEQPIHADPTQPQVASHTYDRMRYRPRGEPAPAPIHRVDLTAHQTPLQQESQSRATPASPGKGASVFALAAIGGAIAATVAGVIAIVTLLP